jgi:SAM-dependent methyltransferase
MTAKLVRAVRSSIKRLFHSLHLRHPESYVGALVVRLRPALKDNAGCEQFGASNRWLHRCVKRHLVDAFYSLDECERQAFRKSKLWGNPGVASLWHDSKRALYREGGELDFQRSYRRELSDRIVELACSRHLETLVELGCGNAFYIAYLRSRIGTKIRNYIGVDLSVRETEQNKNLFPDIEFYCDDTMHFLKDRLSLLGRVLIVSCGTAEYFTEHELERFFELVGSNEQMTLIGFYEPVNIKQGVGLSSLPRGGSAYSHDYLYKAKQAGLEMIYRDLRPVDDAIPDYCDVQFIAENSKLAGRPRVTDKSSQSSNGTTS